MVTQIEWLEIFPINNRTGREKSFFFFQYSHPEWILLKPSLYRHIHQLNEVKQPLRPCRPPTSTHKSLLCETVSSRLTDRINVSALWIEHICQAATASWWVETQRPSGAELLLLSPHFAISIFWTHLCLAPASYLTQPEEQCWCTPPWRSF